VTTNFREKLAYRAQVLAKVRAFFAQRDCLEVDTPLLRQFSVTDPYMRAFRVIDPRDEPFGYLQTSPEYAMKILLSRGSGDIYQLGKVFRADEQGVQHRYEFTMLEWYRVAWNHWQLMDECRQLLQVFVPKLDCEYLSYDEAFMHCLQFAPSQVDTQFIAVTAQRLLGELPENMLRDDYLTLLFDQCVQPHFSSHKATFVYAFPDTQAALAKIGKLQRNDKVSDSALKLADGRTVAHRFEIYWQGLELANGFYELVDAEEQLRRFVNDNQIRKQLGYPEIAIDNDFIGALQKGMPECAGVAMGIDRLLMALCKVRDIGEVITEA